MNYLLITIFLGYFAAFSNITDASFNHADESIQMAYASCTNTTQLMVRVIEQLPPTRKCVGNNKWRVATLEVPGATYQYSFEASSPSAIIEYTNGTNSSSRTPILRIDGCGVVTFTCMITCPDGVQTIYGSCIPNDYCC